MKPSPSGVHKGPTMYRASRIAALALGLVASLIAVSATARPLLAEKSKVSAVFKQMNVPVEAPFKKFGGDITYDAAHPEKSAAHLVIAIDSIDLGDPEYNSEVQGADWFDAKNFPKAEFTTTALKAVGPGQLDAVGQLTIRGKTQQVHFPVTVKTTGHEQQFDGSVVISRLAFGIGQGEWKKTDMVADPVTITVHAVTTAP